MGIIQRQGIKNTIVNFTGVLVGGLSVLFIYPLDDEIYGYAQFLYGSALLVLPFASFGVLTLLIKFFPEFRTSSKTDNGLLSLVILLTTIAIILFSAIVYPIRESLYAFLDRLNFNRAELLAINEKKIWLLSILVIYVTLFYNHVSNFGRIVVPDLIRNLGYKVFLPLLVLFYYYNDVTFDSFANALLFFFTAMLICLIGYIIYLGEFQLKWNPSFLTKERRKRMLNYMTFSSLNNIGGILAFRLDAIMITTMLGLASNGLYFKILFIANVIDIPALAINRIASPIISRAWTENDVTEIQMIYRKSSINLLIGGLLIFLVCWFSMDHLFQISVNPESFENGKKIFLFLGIGKLFNILTSVNNPIITFSRLYKYNLLFLIILGVCNAVLNYYLIGSFDIVGAAMATCLALMLFNIVKFVFILVKFKMHPLSYGTIRVLLIFLVVFGIFALLPTVANNFLQIGIYLTFIPTIFVFLVYKLKISDDLNKLMEDGFQTVLALLK